MAFEDRGMNTPVLRERDMTTDVHQALRAWGFSMLAILAVLGQTALLLTAWVVPAVSRSRLLSGNLRDMFLGQYGLLQNLAFVLAGLGAIGFAFVIRALTAGSVASWVGSLCLGAYGAGAILSAFLPAEQVLTPAGVWVAVGDGRFSVLLALGSLTSAVVGMLALTWRFARIEGWRHVATPSGLLASGALALLFAQTSGPWLGLMQRLLVSVIAAWLVLIACRVPAAVLAGLGRGRSSS
jgi:hypothetical protein